MRIKVNGQWRQEPDVTTVGRLLDDMSLDRRRVAVERNRALVRRIRFDATPLSDNDEIEIVTLVGGG